MQTADRLIAEYLEDVNASIKNELTQLRVFVLERDIAPVDLLKTIAKLRLGLMSTFPNVYIALHLLLTIPVTNCEGKRSFFTLARVKNKLRTNLNQDKLSSLALMAIESELIDSIDFSEIIDAFSKRKARHGSGI